MTATRQKPKGKRVGKRKPLATIWEVPDPLWERVLPILQDFWPTKRTGRHHADWRRALNGGCNYWDSWRSYPRSPGTRPAHNVPAVSDSASGDRHRRTAGGLDR